MWQLVVDIWSGMKDVLSVLLVPLALFWLGIWVPRRIDERRRLEFLHLIYREIKEMAPAKEKDIAPDIQPRWPQYLKKEFVHESIFNNPSQNRDFILSLPPEIAYHVSQLWIEFRKALDTITEADKDVDVEMLEWNLENHGDQFLWHLKEICKALDANAKYSAPQDREGKLYDKIYCAWEWRVMRDRPAKSDLLDLVVRSFFYLKCKGEEGSGRTGLGELLKYAWRLRSREAKPISSVHITKGRTR
jgi:hypothetical protein